jgi:hypothetical protein
LGFKAVAFEFIACCFHGEAQTGTQHATMPAIDTVDQRTR